MRNLFRIPIATREDDDQDKELGYGAAWQPMSLATSQIEGSHTTAQQAHKAGC